MSGLIATIPVTVWLTIVVVLVALVAIGVIATGRRNKLRVIAARVKNKQDVTPDDIKQVRYGGCFGHHWISWPTTWTDMEQAADRGAKTVMELWPEETAEPIDSKRHSRWIQRSRRL
ncbi:hypothetical protein OZX74_00140 [Bifidobacterium sp. ESL0798]|uniref:hypothetical protein n=1 Tax=Bifidobacterium sp. ESL0798 TaxID=2983235 RepID=UPI0023F7E069|nr:hypothetical protein [Bifidobacterium sp. ESL0798]WEV74031.1 hypothetical protein OZX74_00140 [Bifidobacterium sp. ESL0798]